MLDMVLLAWQAAGAAGLPPANEVAPWITAGGSWGVVVWLLWIKLPAEQKERREERAETEAARKAERAEWLAALKETRAEFAAILLRQEEKFERNIDKILERVS